MAASGSGALHPPTAVPLERRAQDLVVAPADLVVDAHVQSLRTCLLVQLVLEPTLHDVIFERPFVGHGSGMLNLGHNTEAFLLAVREGCLKATQRDADDWLLIH